ncbi:phosphoribosylglycinamide formyltransferase [Paenibacillus swuensis]|uniref:Phosphoribosylglycinamide formyltransferase n=1 Tax=Paenibacillus swuensis TaxID=1178515 RepID=A0A172TEA9_9BACL|nr:phosphoribosylglycinamide formyltransferase [Paenibacillus swuensis]ANE45378.1 phosphoribosylglycinamide formyltransferase [Paenibacillus swuensis]
MRRRGKLKLAVFASGNGSNFQAIADAIAAGKLDAHIELLVCDKPQAPVAARAHALGVTVHAFDPKAYPSREAYEREILAALEGARVELIVLAGYMRIITSTLVTPYFGRMINVHPSLLPAFPGIRAMEQALDAGVRVTGVTVHFVDGGMDTGPIIAQRPVSIEDGDTAATLAARLQPVEHELYPQVIGWIAEGRVRLNAESREVWVDIPVAYEH